MDEFGIDAEGYIAAIRAGAIDPFGATAAELEASLEADMREQQALFASLSEAELTAFAEAGATPCLPEVEESEALRRLRLDGTFAGRLKSLAQQAARIEGERRALLAEHMQRALAESQPQMALRELASIAAVELRQSPRGIERSMTDAWRTVTELPLAHDAARAGRISAGHLRVIEQETRAIRDDDRLGLDQRRAVEAELVAVAERTTPGLLGKRAKRVVNAVLTEPLQQRFEVANDRRAVELIDAGSGMCDVVARVPAVLGAGILDRLTQTARSKPKDDPRTFDQYRADAFSEMLLGGIVPDDSHGMSLVQARVSVVLPAMELLHRPGTPETVFPASLDGHILIDAATARRLAGGESVWERLFTDPVTGVALTVDTYRPSAEQKRWLQARDGGCRAPNCGARGHIGDLDHTLDWAKGGTTSIDNLAVLCRRDHTLKHASRWGMRQLDHGIIEWTTPLGKVVSTVPEPIGPTFLDTGPPHTEPWGAMPPPNAPPGPDTPF